MTEGVALNELVVDAQGAPLDYRILDLNPAYEAQSGVSGAQARGKLSGDAYGTAEPPFLAEYAHVAQSGEPLRFQVYFEPLAKHFDITAVAQGEGRFATVYEDITERKRMHEALLVKNSAFDESIAASSIADLDGLIVEANDTFLRFWGYAGRDEVVGKPIASFLADQTEAVAIVTALKEAGQWEGEYVAKRKDGSHFIAHGMATVVRDANGAVSGYQSGVLDFTERKQMEKALQESQLLLTQAEKLGRVGGWELDIETQLQTWTETVYDIHELDNSSRPTVDQGEDFYTPASRPIIERAVQRAIEQGEPFDLELEIITAKGNLRSVHAIGEADLARRRVSGFIQDITDRKQAEEKLREAERTLASLNADLEQRVLDRTAQLDAANKELEAFAYSVSHDLRAPLRHISGFSELLAARSADVLDDRGRHYLETITASVGQMGVLIDDLLQFSRTGRTELQIAEVDMQEVVREALESLQHETAGREIEWSIGALPAVVGDHALLRQVWANLLGNAVKYSRGRTPARIEVGFRDVDEADENVFWVRDNGVGFDMKYAHKLFGVFQRLHTAAEFEGTGIGLANVQRIINRLGGRVWAEAEIDKGAVFCFSLPRRRETPS
jgi:PAS domain S-box-containing protein